MLGVGGMDYLMPLIAAIAATIAAIAAIAAIISLRQIRLEFERAIVLASEAEAAAALAIERVSSSRASRRDAALADSLRSMESRYS